MKAVKEDTKKGLIDSILEVVPEINIRIFSDGSFSIDLWETNVPIYRLGDTFAVDTQFSSVDLTRDMMADIVKVIDILESYGGKYERWVCR